MNGKKYSVNYRRFITVSTLLCLLLTAIGVVLFKWFTKELFSEEYLNIQTIQNGVKLNIRPYAILKGKSVSLSIEIESFENTGLLYADLKKIVFLKDSQGELYLPMTFKTEKQSSSFRKGILTFPPFKGKPDHFTFYVFMPEEVAITWLIKTL